VIDGFIADFYCEEAKLAIEVDGKIHDEEEQQRVDEHREKVFQARGLHVLRLKNDDVVHHMKDCSNIILLTIRKRLGTD
jgi:very-short-patch-repair endonuclease